MSPLAIKGEEPDRGQFLVFGKPCLGEEKIQEVVDTLRSTWIGTGPRTVCFEQAFAQHVESRRALARNSCTVALHLRLIVSGISTGNEVVTSPLTFAAATDVIVLAGLGRCSPASIRRR